MSRVHRLSLPPATGDPKLDQWFREVTSALADSFFNITEVSSSYTFSNADQLVEQTTAGTVITLPTATNVRGKVVYVKNRSSGDIDVISQGGQTVESLQTLTLKTTEAISVYSDTTNWNVF